MARTEISPEYQDIIEASHGRKVLNKIDVEAQVMQQVEQLALVRKNPAAWKAKFRRPTATAMSMSSLVMIFLLLSVTAYAATEYIQIRNSKGEVKIQYIQPKPIQQPDPTGNDKLQQQMQAKALAFAKPGELVGYYIKGGTADQSRALQFVYKEKTLTSYADFSAELRRTGAPVLPEAPEGYSFQKGTVGADSPYDLPAGQQELYRITLNELQAQAKQITGGQRLFMKSVPWTKPNSSSAMYTKDGGILAINAYMMNGHNMEVWQNPKQQPKKHTVSGTEVIINTLDIGEGRQHNYLTWYNEKYDAYFTLSSYGDRTLSEEKQLKLAEELLK